MSHNRLIACCLTSEWYLSCQTAFRSMNVTWLLFLNCHFSLAKWLRREMYDYEHELLVPPYVVNMRITKSIRRDQLCTHIWSSFRLRCCTFLMHASFSMLRWCDYWSDHSEIYLYLVTTRNRWKGKNHSDLRSSKLQCHDRGFKNLCIPAFADMPFGACLALTGFCPIMLNLISRCMLAGSSLSTDSSMLSVE